MNNKNDTLERRRQERRSSDSRKTVLSNCIEASLENYFKDLDGHPSGNLYDMVLAETEKPMLEVVMKETGYNVTKAAEVLGLNRGTLRKKLQKYHIQK